MTRSFLHMQFAKGNESEEIRSGECQQVREGGNEVSGRRGEKYIPFDCCLLLFNVLRKRLYLSESLKDF